MDDFLESLQSASSSTLTCSPPPPSPPPSPSSPTPFSSRSSPPLPGCDDDDDDDDDDFDGASPETSADHQDFLQRLTQLSALGAQERGDDIDDFLDQLETSFERCGPVISLPFPLSPLSLCGLELFFFFFSFLFFSFLL